VVDIDLEKFFDRVCHDKLLGKVQERISDRRVVNLIRLFLKCGVLEDGLVKATAEGTPQGGPLSPILSNLMLDELDRELERRGHCFVRYADDANIYVRTSRAGRRVMKSVTKFLERRLKLKFNKEKSAVARPWFRKFLGFTLSRGAKRAISAPSLQRFKARIRAITCRTRGRSIKQIIEELRSYLQGWGGYYCFCEVRSVLRELDSWIRRRLRSMLWKQWGRSGYRKLRALGIDRELAWNTCNSAHGPWRLSHSPALRFALNIKYFDSLGLPRLTTL
jgi:RNA-directed DNA polymerase